MKKFISIAKIFALMAIAFPTIAFSQSTISGTVSDENSGEKIPGVIISVENSFIAAVTDADGKFNLSNPKKENVKIHVRHISYEDTTLDAPASENNIAIRLKPRVFLSDEVNVIATRAGDKSACAYTNIYKDDIDKQNLGQDLPYLLNLTPSVVVTSDAGTGIGYTGIRIRGSDATRVNVTINGVPVNDAEGHLVYWVDLPDFASSVDNIQIQRGIGTSTNGAGAFGGSINIQSSKLSTEPFAEASSSAGSFNTFKNTVQFGTGLLKNKFAFDGRLSKITSDGYIDRGTSDLKSFYLSGGYYGSKNSLRVIIFSGMEKTYQAWYGVPEDSLATNRTYNPAGEYYNASGNAHYYNNQTDNYQQDYYQLHYSHSVSEHLNVNAALHYTKGKGYYEEFKQSAAFENYGLENVVIASDTITNTDLVRQKWLDNDFYGFIFSGNYTNKKIQLIIGGAQNTYDGDHFGKIIWSQFASNGFVNHVYYTDNALKHDLNIFGKIIYDVTSQLSVLCDLQYRTVDYTFIGLNDDLNSLKQKITLNFFNPKGGITYNINSSNKVYASAALGHKEPTRDDYIQSTPSSRARPEEMIDGEVGYQYTSAKIKAGVNLYYMNYKDQLIVTGKLNDVGEAIRQNVNKSHRAGIEIEFGWSILKNLSFSANATFSENKTELFNEYLYDYATNEEIIIAHRNADISFSPAVSGAGSLYCSPVKNFGITFMTKYVGKQFLDNTSNETRKLRPYVVNNVMINYHIPLSLFKNFEVKLAVYNLFNKKYESNGAAYPYYYSGELLNANYYYPQAGVNWMGGVSLKF